MVEVHHQMNCSVPEEQESRAATPDSPTESSGTRRSQRPHPSAPQGDAWSPESIQVLLDVWASPDIQAMRESRKRRRVIYRAIASRLYKEGVQRSWVHCREMMLALEDLYCSIQEANQKRQGEPIPCPFYEGLEKVLPFTHALHEGPGHEVPEAKHTSCEPSGAYSRSPMPVWMPSWMDQVVPQGISWNAASTFQGENRESDKNSLQEPSQAIPWTPSTFISFQNQMTKGNSPQAIPLETPWTTRPLIVLSNHVTREHTFQHPAQIVPLQPIQHPYIQQQGSTENNHQFQQQNIPPAIPASGIMKHEEAGQCITQNRPQGNPLFNMDHEEPIANSSQDPTALIVQTLPTFHSIQNQETADTTTQSHTPQEITYAPQFCTHNQGTYECHLPNPGLMCPSPLSYSHGPPQFFPPLLYFFPHLHIHT
ncbi:putative uncharacterized protein MSANTD5 [Notamacropus eugenii]|uniref:putative uncharacterized protein MSANTD5 n=1 Tax=Notamacropus eugenii TaxID=9315 RepID=UPI003B67C6A2